MAENEEELSGTQRAAVLLLSLGEDHAASILRHMSPRDVQKVSAAITALPNDAGVHVGNVLGNFLTKIKEQSTLPLGSGPYISNMLEKAFGAEQAENVLNNVGDGSGSQGLEALKWMDPRAIANVIYTEHPQIIAIVISELDSDQAAEVMQELAEECRVDVLLRVARMQGIDPTAMTELDQVLAAQLSTSSGTKPSTSGGAKAVADLLNYMAKDDESVLSKGIETLDSDLAQEIADLMFIFENLKDIDDRGIQALLREVSSEVLTIALKGADEVISEKIFSNMSKRAGEMLKDDLETKGPVKLSEVEKAQKEILVVAQRMAESGDIVLGGKGADEYV